MHAVMMVRPIFMYPAKFKKNYLISVVLLIELFLMIDLLSCHQINLQVRSIQQCFHHHGLVSGMVLFFCVCLCGVFRFLHGTCSYSLIRHCLTVIW